MRKNGASDFGKQEAEAVPRASIRIIEVSIAFVPGRWGDPKEIPGDIHIRSVPLNAFYSTRYTHRQDDGGLTVS
jgi:hypothetical protein